MKNFHFSVFGVQFRRERFPHFLFPLLVIFLAGLLRLLPHPANVAPIGAMALFGGVYLRKKYAIILPLGAMLVSDIFLGLHSTMGFVYGSFILIGVVGMWLRKRKKLATVLGASLFSSLLFFLITNFGVWLMTTMYSKTWQGLVDCYMMGIPFFRNTVLGDLLYTGLFFGGYEIALRLLKFQISNSKLQINSK